MIRLDELVCERAEVSLSQARGLVHVGKVSTSAGERMDKPGELVPKTTEIVVDEGLPYVSRGGVKLAEGLAHFSLNVEGAVAIDVGASTGGFTDCLLQHGAAKVYAVDVGYGQLAWKLRQDPRVCVLERTNIRKVTPDQLDEAPAIFAVDCSFISLKTVLPPLHALLAPDAEGIVLIKPQFEAPRDAVERGGVVRDPSVHDAVLRDFEENCVRLGFNQKAVIPSSLFGPAGNREFLAHLVARPLPPNR